MEQEQAQRARPIYREIAERTEGEMYIGVVGPVRSGKSTFITNFMEQLVLPLIPPGAKLDRIRDELPQSATGRTVMTTQPSFIPSDGAVAVMLSDNASARVRMVDSVGYLIKGALGTQEGEAARMVSTPWSQTDMPFEEAAEMGTRKVMQDHATVGVVVTTDGSVTDLPRSAYAEAEERVVNEMRRAGKPFIVLLNTQKPEDTETKRLQKTLEARYDVPVLAQNVKEMGMEDIRGLLAGLLLEFPVMEAHFDVPQWLDALDDDHWLVQYILQSLLKISGELKTMRDGDKLAAAFRDSEYLLPPKEIGAQAGEGAITWQLPLKEGLFNKILSEQCGAEITGDAHLLFLMKELVKAKKEYDRIAGALSEVAQTGYGLVTPAMSEITLKEPEIMHQGNRFGVRLTASAPTLHLIRSDIDTEITPVLGSEEQSEEFVKFLVSEFERDPQSLWTTNFFGKSLQELVREGLNVKLSRMPSDAQEKVQQALTKMLNEGNGGMICILL